MSAGNGMTAAELAGLLKGSLTGDGSRVLRRCASLATATGDAVTFVSATRVGPEGIRTEAGCILAPAETARQVSGELQAAVIAVSDVRLAWQQALVALHGHRVHPAVGVSPLAHVDATAVLGAGVNVHAFASIGPGVVVGDNTSIYPHVTLMENVRIGADTVLYPGVTVYHGCAIGDRVIVHANCVIGSDGYGYVTTRGSHRKIPQVGCVVIEDDVELGACTVVQRATVDRTVIGQGSKLGDLVCIGHNSNVGAHNLMVSQTGVAGSVTTGKYVVMGGQVGVSDHVTIADMTRIAAQSGVVMNIEEPGGAVGGSPAMDAKVARRAYLQFAHLPELVARVRALEAELKKHAAVPEPPK